MHAREAVAGFGALDGALGDAGFAGELLDGEPQHRAGGADLAGCQDNKPALRRLHTYHDANPPESPGL